jgi:DNA repair exonuclease SbcCD ATPase subunit
MTGLKELGNSISSLRYEIKANKSVLDNSRNELSSITEQLRVLEHCGQTLKVIGENKKKATTGMIERVVGLAIKEVFGFDYQFIIEVSSEKKVLTKFKLKRPDGLELDLMNSVGGGLIDVVSFVLRALILSSLRPKREQIMFMDESFSRVSKEYIPKVASLLKSLSKQLNMRYLIVTHNSDLADAATNSYVARKDGDSTVFDKIL